MAVTINRLSDFIRRQRSARTSVILPFLIIAIAFSALGYRSWELSGRMERSLDSLAIQYLEYTAEITARRADAATQGEIYRASEEWQQIERLSGGSPQFGSLAEWVKQNKWILSAIYVPDSDPTNSIFHSELADPKTVGERLSGEFFTASGSVRYTYSPGRLLDEVRPAISRESAAREGHTYESRELSEQAHVAVVPASAGSGLVRGEQGFTVFVPLAAPLEKFAVAASIETGVVREGWQSHRVISIVFSVVAIALLTVGAWLAIRGLRKENEAMQLRAALIANVSHELRTPLAMIRLAAETLQRGSDRLSAKDRGDMQDSILREVLHLSHLVENVLDVARLQKGTKRMAFMLVDPASLVASVIQSYAAWISSKGFAVELDLSPGIGEQMWDRDSVSRAVVNLIDNAIKYSEDSRRIHVAVRDAGSDVVIEVKDYGIGIHPTDLQRIFDPYYRARFSDTETRRGAGLGLTLVHQIAEAHGGRVEVESEPGRGSTFRLVFPKRAPLEMEAHREEALGDSSAI